MSKRKKKRGGGRSPYEGYETEVWGSSPIQIAAIEKEYRSIEEESFQMGAEDSWGATYIYRNMAGQSPLQTWIHKCPTSQPC